MSLHIGFSFWLVGLLLTLTLSSCGRSYVASEVSIIPEPVSVTTKARSFTLSNHTKVCFPNLGQNSKTARYITKSLRQLHFHLKLSGREQGNSIVFTINDSVDDTLGDEGYVLEIRPSGIRVSANSETGLFYGFQSLVQMLPADISKTRYSKVTLPECTVVDYPQYAWRGCHLDVSRHYFSVKYIKRLLDVMAAYKMNKFHWHLTDDHGWRLESQRYPLLNKVGSWRGDRSGMAWQDALPPIQGEAQNYGGFYTRDEVEELVAYAAQLHIDIVPEIDVPGHASAILASYPNLSCGRNEEIAVQTGPYWPPTAVLCAGNDSVLPFLFDLLDEVVSMFPSEYIHIGGNEVFYDEWELCPLCQAKMRNLHLENEGDLQQWLARQLCDHLAELGRHAVVWDEVDAASVGDDDMIMAWRGTQRGMEAAAEGRKVIMTPSDFCSLDYYQANPKYQPQAIGQPITLEKVYSLELVPKDTPAGVASKVAGGQCELWTEYITRWSQAEYMLLPRLCAVSEVLWTPAGRRDWSHFRNKVQSHKLRFEALDYNFCEGSFKPSVKIANYQGDNYIVSVSSEVEGTFVYYTTDGTMPTLESATYVEPLVLKGGTMLRLRSVFNGLPQEEVYDYVIK